MATGHLIIDPGLALPRLDLDRDAQVRILSYLVRHANSFNCACAGVELEVIAIDYRGGRYPVVGIPVQEEGPDYDRLSQLAFDLMDCMGDWVDARDASQLRALASGEPLTWLEVNQQP